MIDALGPVAASFVNALAAGKPLDLASKGLIDAGLDWGAPAIWETALSAILMGGAVAVTIWRRFQPSSLFKSKSFRQPSNGCSKNLKSSIKPLASANADYGLDGYERGRRGAYTALPRARPLQKRGALRLQNELKVSRHVARYA